MLQISSQSQQNLQETQDQANIFGAYLSLTYILAKFNFLILQDLE